MKQKIPSPKWLLFAALLAGCAVGPNYSRPKVNMESQFGELSRTTNAYSLPASRAINSSGEMATWWRSFNDPELDRLIDGALKNNYGLQIAAARIRQARAQRGVAASELYPHVQADAGYDYARGSGNVSLPFGGSGAATPGKNAPRSSDAGSQSGGESGGNSSTTANQLTPFGKGGLPGVSTELYQAGFDANWEIDVFGGTRRKVEAANAELQAAVENQRDVMVTLIAEVARNYLELRGTQQRLAIARENQAAQNDVLELTRAKSAAGLATDFDVARAAAQAATTTATIPVIEARQRQSIHALSILLGKEPNELGAALADATPLPDLPPEVPVGLPSELLERRPDIRRAEDELRAANARIGGARADLFPKFALTGSAGLDSSSINHLLDWDSRYFVISPTAVWPIFDAGRIASNIRLQTANREEAALQYRSTILTALREVEDSLIAYSTEQIRRAALTEAMNQSREALEIARDRYKNGLIDFLNVLDAQRNSLAAQDALALSNQSVAVNLVALYKALGGGWDITKNQTTAAANSSLRQP